MIEKFSVLVVEIGKGMEQLRIRMEWEWKKNEKKMKAGWKKNEKRME